MVSGAIADVIHWLGGLFRHRLASSRANSKAWLNAPSPPCGPIKTRPKSARSSGETDPTLGAAAA
ncbi:MAG: hypothetical protein R2882_15100 [Gemmatimonadales bacterium]